MVQTTKDLKNNENENDRRAISDSEQPKKDDGREISIRNH